jgi:hypothetical protein
VKRTECLVTRAERPSTLGLCPLSFPAAHTCISVYTQAAFNIVGLCRGEENRRDFTTSVRTHVLLSSTTRIAQMITISNTSVPWQQGSSLSSRVRNHLTLRYPVVTKYTTTPHNNTPHSAHKILILSLQKKNSVVLSPQAGYND